MIRAARMDELEKCAAVIRCGFLTVAEEFGLTQENCPTNGAFIPVERLERERAAGNQMLVLTEGEEIVGFLELEDKGDALILEKLSVLPEYRHKGYGLSLINYARMQARMLGKHKLSLAIIEENTRLRNWYELHGFTHIGIKQYDHLPFTVGFMEMLLAPHGVELSNALTAEEFCLLTLAIGWGAPPMEQVRLALQNSLVCVSARKNGKVVGMGRLVGDGALSFFIKDLAVLPAYQGRGVGSLILESLLRFARESAPAGGNICVELMSAKGKEGFYEKFGFFRRPTESQGCGMSNYSLTGEKK